MAVKRCVGQPHDKLMSPYTQPKANSRNAKISGAGDTECGTTQYTAACSE